MEEDRSGYNSVVKPFDLMDSYLPAFRAAVVEGKVNITRNFAMSLRALTGMRAHFQQTHRKFRVFSGCRRDVFLQRPVRLRPDSPRPASHKETCPPPQFTTKFSCVAAAAHRNGVPTCANQKLTEILRDMWQFDGYITSDSGAIRDISGAHKWNKTSVEGTAAGLLAGCDINSGTEYKNNVEKAVRSGLIAETVVDAVRAAAFSICFGLHVFSRAFTRKDEQPEIE